MVRLDQFIQCYLLARDFIYMSSTFLMPGTVAAHSLGNTPQYDFRAHDSSLSRMIQFLVKIQINFIDFFNGCFAIHQLKSAYIYYLQIDIFLGFR